MADSAPATPAMRVLRAAGVEHTVHLFDYERHPGALGAAEAIGVAPHETVKTIVFTGDGGAGLVVLMHGDREVSTKKLARAVGMKSARPADQKEATRITGYVFGGTSPLGMRTPAPVLAQHTITTMGTVYVNGGSRGFLVGIDAAALLELTGATTGDLAVE